MAIIVRIKWVHESVCILYFFTSCTFPFPLMEHDSRLLAGNVRALGDISCVRSCAQQALLLGLILGDHLLKILNFVLSLCFVSEV